MSHTNWRDDQSSKHPTLSREQMLAQLNEHGEDAGSDFNDSDEVLGWLGWTVRGDVLTIRHERDRPRAEMVHRWRLVPDDDEDGL